MSDLSMTTANEPDGAPRIANLDILRGVAILGILFMNINDMGGSLWASFDDPRHLGWTMADQIAWWLRYVLANGTARGMLEMLFGVGMVILTDRAASAIGASAGTARWWPMVGRALFGPAAVLRGYYLRNFILFLFGLVHIFILLWPGDILHTYGIAAMVAFLFRRLGPKALLGIGLLFALLQLVFFSYSIHTAQQLRLEVPRLEAKQAAGQTLTKEETETVTALKKRQAERAKEKAVLQKRIAREDHQRSAATGDFASWAGVAWSSMLFVWGISDGIGEATFLEPLFIWEAAGTMLIGAALFKWGVIQGMRSRRFYWRMAIAGYALGLIGRGLDADMTMRFDNYPHYIYAWSEVTRIATTIGHIALINLLVTSVAGAKLMRPFAAAGRTALTIYIAQTIICLWVLYPPFALGLYGKTGWAVLMLTAVAVNAVLLWAANVWVRHYDIAPVEWAWRSLVERRALPWRKRAKTGDNQPPARVAAA